MTRLSIRHLAVDDVPFADSLRAIAGWNQTPQDWQRFLDLSPGGCLLAECDGQHAATATTIRYGQDVAWIGMVLVHPNFRRRGIARILLGHCIELLRAAKVRTIKLDATAEGREVYLRLGFRDEFQITRHLRETFVPQPASTARPASKDDLPQIIALDCAAMGACREQLLRRLVNESPASPVIVENGFALLRTGFRADHLGPVIAPDSQSAIQLATALASTPRPLICDIPDHQQPFTNWAQSAGFKPQRQLIRMSLGPQSAPRASCFAIGSPEFG